MAQVHAQARRLTDEEIRAFHEEIFVANIHADFSVEIAKARQGLPSAVPQYAGRTNVLEKIYLPRLIDGGVDFEFYTVGGDDFMFTQDDDLTRGTLRSIDHAWREIEEEPDGQITTIALRADDIVRAKREGKRSFLLTIEGAEPLQEDLSILRNMYRLGLRSVILTWFKANPTADGVGEARNGGLTQFGRQVIEEMNRLGMVIDVAQCAPRSLMDAVELSQDPVVASHCNTCGVHPHRRNLTDEQLKAIAEKGGILGVTTYPAHVDDRGATVDRFFDHVDHAVNVMGEDHVAIGLNIVVHKKESAVDFYEKSNIEYADLWLKGFENVDKIGVATEGLIKRGYNEATVEKIMGSNVLRLLREVIG